jgi:hypothetical protein
MHDYLLFYIEICGKYRSIIPYDLFHDDKKIFFLFFTSRDEHGVNLGMGCRGKYLDPKERK